MSLWPNLIRINRVEDSRNLPLLRKRCAIPGTTSIAIRPCG